MQAIRSWTTSVRARASGGVRCRAAQARTRSRHAHARRTGSHLSSDARKYHQMLALKHRMIEGEHCAKRRCASWQAVVSTGFGWERSKPRGHGGGCVPRPSRRRATGSRAARRSSAPRGDDGHFFQMLERTAALRRKALRVIVTVAVLVRYISSYIAFI